MKAKIGIMRATIGYACTPGPPTVEKGNVVVVLDATNMPAESMIDVFVARVDNPGYSIGCTRHEVTILEGITGCHVCAICDELTDGDLCTDCNDLEG